MKARFEVPELEVVRFVADDIITESGCPSHKCKDYGGGGGDNIIESLGEDS